ncbi:uncharacterized protein LOC120264649 [Dioscorea cayenensis subsp. rotundata]|uniref:Uncharacterized protein LOC120264649 n=1 Tax=Dioscorea cayennensis subsp. rotundata TaxID=55577 RepID=A0AB40BLX6_DIOCR|nr:uncharacterized protein LOC120264649 [Dioscorea cayenensis subsp. rotundata]
MENTLRAEGGAAQRNSGKRGEGRGRRSGAGRADTRWGRGRHGLLMRDGRAGGATDAATDGLSRSRVGEWLLTGLRARARGRQAAGGRRRGRAAGPVARAKALGTLATAALMAGAGLGAGEALWRASVAAGRRGALGWAARGRPSGERGRR